MDISFPTRVTDRFSEGFWSIELSMRGHGGAGPRFLCHARNDREARRVADRLKDGRGGVLGFSYQRLAHGVCDYPRAARVGLGQCQEITDSAEWAILETSQLRGTGGTPYRPH